MKVQGRDYQALFPYSPHPLKALLLYRYCYAGIKNSFKKAEQEGVQCYIHLVENTLELTDEPQMQSRN